MKKFKISILVMFLLTTTLFPNINEWLYQGKLNVGKQPGAILSTKYYGIHFILCNGIDHNKNGIQEEGDEAPSIWYMQASEYILSSISVIGPYSIPKKLLDLPFRHQELPFRGAISDGDGDAKIYVDTKDGLAEISFKMDYINEEISIAPTLKILSEINPIHILWGMEYNTNNEALYLSVRDKQNNKGFVLKYDLKNNVITDTIPAQPNIMMSGLVDNGKEIYILNNSSDSEPNNLLIYHIGKIIGDGSPLLLKKIDIPQIAYSMETIQVDGIRAIISSPTTDTITTIKGDYAKSIIDSKKNDLSGLKNFYGNNLIWASSNDGNIYQISSYYGVFNVYDSIDAYGIPECIAINYTFLIITTPFKNDNTPDNTITLYAKDFKSVDDNVQIDNMIYPNPASDLLTIDLRDYFITGIEDELPIVKIFDILGFEVLNVKLQNIENTQNIDISKLPTGTYNLKIGKYIQKFLKN